MEQPTPTPHAASTGLAATSAAWLDLSYESSRPEYEAAVRSVGIEPGWHVLDAGCGSGGFLPALANLAGPTGRLTALDLAPDNIAVVGERLEQQPLACPVETRVGSILDLPFADARFDAVWVAQVLIYLSDEECAPALAELRRVTRPGGLIAEGKHRAALSVSDRSPLLVPGLHPRTDERVSGCSALPGARALVRTGGT